VIRDVDIVYALAPQDVRVTTVLEAARAGRHLFIEEPFALTLSEADRQIEAIETAG
jgi:predicted dehydrogenase